MKDKSNILSDIHQVTIMGSNVRDTLNIFFAFVVLMDIPLIHSYVFNTYPFTKSDLINDLLTMDDIRIDEFLSIADKIYWQTYCNK